MMAFGFLSSYIEAGLHRVDTELPFDLLFVRETLFSLQHHSLLYAAMQLLRLFAYISTRPLIYIARRCEPLVAFTPNCLRHYVSRQRMRLVAYIPRRWKLRWRYISRWIQGKYPRRIALLIAVSYIDARDEDVHLPCSWKDCMRLRNLLLGEFVVLLLFSYLFNK